MSLFFSNPTVTLVLPSVADGEIKDKIITVKIKMVAKFFVNYGFYFLLIIKKEDSKRGLQKSF